MARDPIHVGYHIQIELEAMKMTPAAFAKKLKIPVKRLNEILHEERGIDGDMAVRLGHFFGSGPDFWMSLQGLYEIRKAEANIGKIVKTLPKFKATKLKKAA